ncbi:MAG: hypothetical protein Q8P55_02655 [bacterium]|nr:hypothetical protein [bacterium]
MVAKVSSFRKTKKHSTAKKVFGWSVLLLVALLGLFLIFYNIRLYQKRAELQEQALQLQKEIVDLRNQEEQLQYQLEVSGTEEYQERVLREQGLYQKPGEEVVTVLPSEEPEQTLQAEKIWWNPFTWFQK